MPRGRGKGDDLTGRRFGRLLVIQRANGGTHRSWECRCDCGEAVFTGGNKLTRGQKKSCGCLKSEARQQRAQSRGAGQSRLMFESAYIAEQRPVAICCIDGCGEVEKHVAFCAHHYDMWNRYGHPLAGTMANRRVLTSTGTSKEYKAWNAMKTRCTNPNSQSYSNYGERGIQVCERWLASFESFLVDMGKAPAGSSLDRRDVNGNYEPENCKWATSRQQMRNTRATVLNEQTVREGKRRYRAGESVAAIARSLNMSYGGMYAAVTGRSWAEIDPEGTA